MRWLNVSHSCSDYSAFAHASTHDAARCVSKSCSAICASPSTHHAARHSPALFALVHRHIMQLDIRLVASKSKCNCIAASSLLVMCFFHIYIYIYIYIYICVYTYKTSLKADEEVGGCFCSRWVDSHLKRCVQKHRINRSETVLEQFRKAI